MTFGFVVVPLPLSDPDRDVFVVAVLEGDAVGVDVEIAVGVSEATTSGWDGDPVTGITIAEGVDIVDNELKSCAIRSR